LSYRSTNESRWNTLSFATFHSGHEKTPLVPQGHEAEGCIGTPGRMPAVAQDHGVTCGMISKWKKESSLFHQLNQITPMERAKKKNHPGPALKRPDLDDYLYFNDLKKHTMLTPKL
jgi:hypothetical protein